MKTIRLLTVDDSKFNRDLVIKTLRHEYPEIEVTEAPNGRRAQQLLKSHSYDLVLCDWEMPEMDGIELLKWVRSEENLKEQPFIMVTSLDKKEHVVTALKAGVNDYIAKPFSTDQLVSKVVKQLLQSKVITTKDLAGMGYKPRISGAGGAELLAGAGSTPEASPKKSKGPNQRALIWSTGDKYPVTLKELTLQEAVVLTKRVEGLPNLGEPVHLGLIGGDEEDPIRVAVKGFVTLLQLGEKKPDAKSQLMRIQLIKQNPETASLFSQLLS